MDSFFFEILGEIFVINALLKHLMLPKFLSFYINIKLSRLLLFSFFRMAALVISLIIARFKGGGMINEF